MQFCNPGFTVEISIISWGKSNNANYTFPILYTNQKMNLLNSQKTGWQAVADLGTNTFQLLIGKKEDEILRTGFRIKTGVMIGKGGMANRLITPKAINRAKDCLLDFGKHLNSFGLSTADCITLATSAFRNALNAKEVIETLRYETGFVVQVLDGDQEANLIFNGVQGAGVLQPEKPGLVVDIGGGSVEFILCTGNEAVWRNSFEIGGLRLIEKFHTQDPIPQENILALESYLETILQPLWAKTEILKPEILVGCSGSFDTLVEMDLKKRNQYISDIESFPAHTLDINAFQNLSAELISAPLGVRLAMPGMIPLRAEMMVVAVILIRLLLIRLEINDIRVSTWALKEGAMIRILGL